MVAIVDNAVTNFDPLEVCPLDGKLPGYIFKLLTINIFCDDLVITLGEFFNILKSDSLEQEIK